MAWENKDMTADETPETTLARVHRRPRYGVFLGLGALLGVIAALVLTLTGAVGERSMFTGAQYSTSQVFGFVLIYAVPIGIAVGGLVALVIERLSARRERVVRVQHEQISVSADEPTGEV